MQPQAKRGRLPRALMVSLFSAALVTGCSGRALGPSPTASASLADDSGYGGSLPASGDPWPTDAVASPVRSVVPVGVPVSADASSVDATDGSAEIDAAPEGACVVPLSPGDLKIDELMIESVAGAGDNGEWLEVRSDLDCAANLNGLSGECPRGAKVATFAVSRDEWLPPRGTFLIADSIHPAINHHLPGLVFAWFGHAGDVLRNKGSTVTLSMNGTVIDTVSYPALALVAGSSVAFPNACDPALRGDFTHWKRSTASWFPGFFGTPNAPNTDVECP